VLIPLGWAGHAHALGVFGLCVNSQKDACCYPQQNAFTPSCCGITVVTQTAVAGPVDGGGHFGMFHHGNFGVENNHRFKGFWSHWCHRRGAGCAECGGGYMAGESMGYGGYAMGEGYPMGDGYAMGEEGFPTGEGYAMGEEGTILGDGSYAQGQNTSPMGEGSFPVGQNALGLGAGETLVGDVTIDGKVVSPNSLGRMMIQPQAPALAPGANIFPTPAQQYVPPPAARPMLPPTSMYTPNRATYPTIQQTNYSPSYVPAQTGYYPYAVPQYGYYPYGQQQVPYYWNTCGGR
jgi:hypothetical protein